MLELTLEVAFLSNVSPERRPAEMYVMPWPTMLRMDAVSAARFALNGIEICWELPEVLRRDGTVGTEGFELNVTMPTRATFKST